MENIFMDKTHQPSEQDLEFALGLNYLIWAELQNYLNSTLDKPSEEWNYPGKKYGWSFRMKSKKRNIIYFLPYDGYFKVAFVFGPKATAAVMKSQVSEALKEELQNAKVYAEGRGIRIEVKNIGILADIKELIRIKLEN